MARHRSGRDGRAPSQRQLRVGEALRHALSDVFARGDLRDPALAGRSITVSEVTVSPDLRHATAYVLPLGGADTEAVIEGLQRAAAHLGGRVAPALQLKRMPQLSFAADPSFDRASEIDRLLRSVPAPAAQGSDADG